MRKKVTRHQIEECRLCMDRVTPELMGACASVGISRRKSTQQMLLIYLAQYHAADHQEMP